MNELFEAGKLVPVIDEVYRLADLPEAFRRFGTSRVRKYVTAITSQST